MLPIGIRVGLSGSGTVPWSFRASLLSSLVPEVSAGSPTCAYTRATVGTVFGQGASDNSGASQLMLTASSGEARFGGARRVSSGVWSPTYADGTPIDSSALTGLFIEGARTNLALNSEGFGNASWAKANLTTVADAAVAPSGYTTADKIVENTALGSHQVHFPVTTVELTGYTMSCHFKAAERTQAGVHGWLNETAENWVDLSTGAVWSPYGSRCSSTSAGNGWWRIAYNFTTSAGQTAKNISAETIYGGAVVYTGDGTSGVYAWGYQFEQGTFKSSYIATDTTTVTRNADVASYAVSGNIGGTNNQTIALEWTPYAASMGTVYLWGSYVDANNSTAILHDGTNIIFRRRIAGVNYDATKALTYTAGTTYKIAARMSSTTGGGIYVNGVQGTNNANTTAMQFGTTFEVGSDGNGGNQAFSNLRNLGIANAAMSDAVIARL